MSPGKYKIVSDGSIYNIEYKETISREDDGKKKRAWNYWGQVIEATVKSCPGEPFKIPAESVQKWEYLIKIGYVVACD